MHRAYTALLLVAVLLPGGVAFAPQPQDQIAPVTRVLLVGDSWAGRMWSARTYRQAFAQFGHADILEDGELIGAGGTAAVWATDEALGLLRDKLADSPSIDIVVISLGGNDILAGACCGGWHTALSEAQESELLDRIDQDLRTVATAALAARPDVEVLLSGYDYPNFVETLEQGDAQEMWANLGQPDPLAINQVTVALEARKLALAQDDARIHYVQSLGLMQYLYGYSADLSPGTVPFPGREQDGFQPLPGGDINYPGPPIAFALEGRDPIHLNDFAYQVFAAHQMIEYFFPKFRGQPSESFRSQGGEFDGSVRADGSTHAEFVTVGDEGPENGYRGILSFDTGSIPDDAVITKASIYLGRIVDCCGSNPFASAALGRPRIDVVRGAFDRPALQPGDFDAAATAADAGAFIGRAPEVGHRLRIDFEPAGLAAINTGGLTQVRIYFPDTDGEADHVSFNTGDAAAFDPVLDVFYQTDGSLNGSAGQSEGILSGISLSANGLIAFLCVVTGVVIGLALLAVWLSARGWGSE